MKTCPDCGEEMTIKLDPMSNAEFLQCSSYPKCEWAEILPEHIRLERMTAPRLMPDAL